LNGTTSVPAIGDLSSMTAGYNLAITTGNSKRSLEEMWCELLTHEAVLERLSAVYLCTGK
jgi:hypothetical protein